MQHTHVALKRPLPDFQHTYIYVCVCVYTGRQVDGRGAELTQELCEQGVGQGSHSLSCSSHVHNRLMVSVDVNQRGRRRRTILPTSLIRLMVSVERGWEST